VGTLWLAADRSRLADRFASYMSIVVAVLAASFLIALAVSSFLQSSISSPILALARTAKTIAERRDYSVRVSKTVHDEIGELTDAFNHMLVQISRRDEALREGAERLHLALEASQTGTWDWNLADDRITWDNDLHKLFGLKPGEFRGTWKDSVRMIHPADRATVDQVIRRALEVRKEFVVEFRVVWPDGAVHHLASRGKALFDEHGKPLRMTGVCMNITQSKEAEDEIRRLNAELEQRVEERTSELAAANQELEAFTYSVSHDLRAPLRHIDAYARILCEEFASELPAPAQKYIERIRHGTDSMGELVDDLLNLGRVGRQELNWQLVDLNDLVDESIRDLDSEVRDRKIDWKISPLPQIRCDKGLVRQIFANLISNAVKYTRPRESAVIEIGQAGEQKDLAIFVRDNGVGFSMNYAHKLFGVFQRLHRADEFEGTGVGLAIVDRIVRKHGGRVWAEAELDRGAVFYFTLGPSKDSPNS
jgi:PAS domain S-box-containing protein